MKAFMALGVRKYIPEKLIFVNFMAFVKSDFLKRLSQI